MTLYWLKLPLATLSYIYWILPYILTAVHEITTLGKSLATECSVICKIRCSRPKFSHHTTRFEFKFTRERFRLMVLSQTFSFECTKNCNNIYKGREHNAPAEISWLPLLQIEVSTIPHFSSGASLNCCYLTSKHNDNGCSFIVISLSLT